MNPQMAEDFEKLLGTVLGGLLGGGGSEPVAREATAGFIVSTVITRDMGPETAILDKSGAHPVQRYSTREEAEAGHAAWVERVKGGLREVVELGYGELVDPKVITLQPRN